jgi:ammonium transporter, Amt family
MIAFFSQTPLAAGPGFPTLPNGLLFGGGGSATKQLGLEVLGIVAVMSVVFAISYVTVAALSAAFGGILTPRPSDQVVAVTELHVAG